MATVTHWHKGRALSPAEFEALQAEKAARRPAEAVDRCLLVNGGGAFCMKRMPSVHRILDRLFGFRWQGFQTHRGDDGQFVRVTVELWSNCHGTRGSVEAWVSFDPADECGRRVYFRRYRGLLPTELLPAWVGQPLGNLQRFGRDVSQWEV